MAGYKDITGQRFGKLVAVRPTEKRYGTNIIWEFKCDCGNTIEHANTNLPYSCGCSLEKDISGQQFGRLTAIKSTGRIQNKTHMWLFKCDCGKMVELNKTNVVYGNTKSCGCLKRDLMRGNAKGFGAVPGNYVDLSGKRFGMLTVVKRANDDSGKTRWLCRCDCGNEIVTETTRLHDGLKRSCGCVNNRLYCVYKHIAPDGRIYIGISSRRCHYAWNSGQKYDSQYVMKSAIDAVGGHKAFYELFNHFVLSKDEKWIKTDGTLKYEESNFFTQSEAEMLKRKYIALYDTTNPEKGLNAATGGIKDFKYSDEAKERTSNTKSGSDGRTDWCVYMHTNKVNGKVYVGKTCRNPKARWSGGAGYKRSRGQGKALSHFYHAIEKYGWDNFEHVVIKENMTRDESSILEKELIKKYDSTNPEKGYNITKGGEGSTGAYHSEETKKLLAEKARKRIAETGVVNFKGQKHSEETKRIIGEKAKKRIAESGIVNFKGQKHSDKTKQLISEINRKEVTAYDVTGKKIATFDSLTIAANKYGISTSAISSCVRRDTKFCSGMIWRYINVEQLPPEEIPSLKQKSHKRV